METVEELWTAYRNWKRLSQEEGVAIQRSQWAEVHQAQEQKRVLQSEIIRLTDRIKVSINSTIEQANFDLRLRTIVNELILLETQNNLTLQACIDATQEQRRSLEATSHRLRRVHDRYVPSRSPVWENLS